MEKVFEKELDEVEGKVVIFKKENYFFCLGINKEEESAKFPFYSQFFEAVFEYLMNQQEDGKIIFLKYEYAEKKVYLLKVNLFKKESLKEVELLGGVEDLDYKLICEKGLKEAERLEQKPEVKRYGNWIKIGFGDVINLKKVCGFKVEGSLERMGEFSSNIDVVLKLKAYFLDKEVTVIERSSYSYILPWKRYFSGPGDIYVEVQRIREAEMIELLEELARNLEEK